MYSNCQSKHPKICETPCYKNIYKFNLYIIYSLECGFECLIGGGLLHWATRTKVALGVVRALDFLHYMEIPLNHHNVKSSKIFLDDVSLSKVFAFLIINIYIYLSKKEIINL